jgi:hypothetical protein
MNKILAFVTVLFVIACNDNGKTEEKSQSYSEQIIGEWNIIYLKVDVNTKNNSDSAEVLEVSQQQWEEKLKIKPIRTFFRADSTWNSAHYNLNDSLIYNPSGKWWLEGNKIIMFQQFPFSDTADYTLSIKNDTATFESVIDWDIDGKKDDKYFGKQIKNPVQ